MSLQKGIRSFLDRSRQSAGVYLGMLSGSRAFVGPRTIQIELPSSCDHACDFCCTDIHGVGQTQLKRGLRYEDILQIIDEALTLGTRYFNILSIGEPLLYPKIKGVLTHLATQSRGTADITIVTNGSSLHRLGVDFIREHNLHLWVSLHAGDFVTWQTVHRPAEAIARKKYDDLEATLKALTATGHRRLTLHNVISNRNIYQLDAIFDYARKVGAPRVNFQHLVGAPDCQLDALEERILRGALPRLRYQFERAGIEHNLATFGAGAPTLDFYRHHRCYIGWLWSNVTSTGEVTGCCGGKTVGDLRDRSYTEIWNKGTAAFRRAGFSMPEAGPVKGCACHRCPHLTLNTRANRLTGFRISIPSFRRDISESKT
jgi:MoaA/NifB/PqqE/SkfB family radical SAM enzyme